VYTIVSNIALIREPMDTVGRVNLANNTKYYVKITSTGASSLTGANASFTLYPNYFPDSISITSYGGGDDMATYCPGYPPTHTYYRVFSGGQITVNGFIRRNGKVLPYSIVDVYFWNPYYPAQYNELMHTTVIADGSGYYTATLPVGQAHGDYTCIFGPTVWFIHTYDIKGVIIVSGGKQISKEVYVLASSSRYY